MRTKISTTFLTMFIALIASFGLSAQSAEPVQTETTSKVAVYYFHFNSRCATCKAIESETQKSVKELFGSDVSFASQNLDKEAGEALGEELGVNSQSLIAVKGDEKINLTNDAFMYARTKPEKFKKILEEKIKPLL
ncbi:MAG: nitrophenyl compound nitroreductase subunit ArsF family protein [Bacteroidales bacterium]|nr:nitrophenyl compound nitroreductase subunit ArsF family protein [Bacteroidales bacterium]